MRVLFLIDFAGRDFWVDERGVAELESDYLEEDEHGDVEGVVER